MFYRLASAVFLLLIVAFGTAHASSIVVNPNCSATPNPTPVTGQPVDYVDQHGDARCTNGQGGGAVPITQGTTPWVMGVGGVTATGGFTFPGTPYAVYSSRLAVAGYAGAAMNVERSSDSTTQDIGFSGTDFNVSAFNTFCANTLCFLHTWYDQSGNGRDLTQATATNQPLVVVLNSKVYVSFTANRVTHVASASAFTAAGDLTVGTQEMVGSDRAEVPISEFDSTNGYLFLANGLSNSPNHFSWWASTGGETLDTVDSLFAGLSTATATLASGALTLYVNGVNNKTASGISSANASQSFWIGGIAGNNNFSFDGLITEAYVYASGLSSANVTAISLNERSYWPDPGFSAPYSGAHSVTFSAFPEQISLGNVLELEYTQPWTVFAAIQVYANPNQASVIFTNVPPPGTLGNAFPGYESFIDQNCHLIVRIIHNIAASQYIDVRNTTLPVCDLKKHFYAVSYDGSGTAAGVKMYLDGTALTTTTVLDTLGGQSIVATGQLFLLGQQQNNVFPWLGTLGHFQLDKVVRSASYIASVSSPSSLPPIDSNTAVSLALTEGTGTTANDASGNGLNGTLTSANQWMP